MKTNLRTLCLSSVLLMPSFSALAGDLMVRMRAISVLPQESGTPSVVKGDVQLNNDSVPEVDFTYFFTDKFALELILATATHKASVYDSALGNLDLGDVSLLPPTLLAQYHQQMGKFRPYVGAGLNYTVFYGADHGIARSVRYENSMGYALQIGTDFEIAPNTYINVDVKKLYLSTDVKVNTYDNGSVSAEVDINPYIVGLGIGYKF